MVCQAKLVDVDKNMKFKKINLLLGFLVVLILLYAINIFNLNKINKSLSGDPVKLSLTIINPSEGECGNCFNTKSIVGFINSQGELKITKEKTLTPESSKYSSFVEKNGIKNLPAIVISGDIANVKVAGMFKTLSGEKINGNIVLQNLLPYYDLKTKEKKGFIDVVLLKDGSCSDCFDVTQYLNTLNRFGMAISSSFIYDISSPEGKLYIKKYNIKKVPTMLMSASADDYPGFKKLWESVGTVEPDGWFIFRKVQDIGGKFSNI